MRTLTAMFDSRADAERARDRLSDVGISNDNVTILDQGSLGTAGTSATYQDRSLWEDIKALFTGDEHHYEEGLRRGAYLLTARVEDTDVDRAIDILDDDGAVDLDERTASWRNDGWTDDRRDTDAAAHGGTASALAAGGLAGRESRDDLGEPDETRIPIVEEHLRVGKREVARGGVRVRSYIVEEPVHESVRLREENVTIDRRPVSGDHVADAGDLLRERTIEVIETSEEAVIDKHAEVREEVVIGKTVGERVQQVDDTVRHTEVEVERLHGEEQTGHGVDPAGHSLHRDDINRR